MAKTTNITIIGNDKRYSYEFETDFANYDNVADQQDGAFIKMFNLEHMYKIVDEEDSIDENSNVDNVISLNIKLNDCLRESSCKESEWTIRPIKDCAVDIDIDPLNLYKWLKFVIYFTKPIFKLSKLNGEFDISDTDVDTALIMFLDKIYSHFKHKLNSTPLMGIMDKLDAAYKSVSESIHQFVPLLHGSNKLYTEHVKCENHKFIRDIMERYHTVMTRNANQKDLNNYKELGGIFWDFFQKYLPVTVIETGIYSLLQVSLILLATNVNITFEGGAEYESDEEVLNTYDIISNVIGTRLKVHILIPNDEPWIRYLSNIICNTDNKKKSIEETKTYILNTIYKKYKNEFKDVQINSNRFLYCTNKDTYNERMETFCRNMANGDRATYNLNTKVLGDLCSGDETMNKLCIPYLYFIDSDRIEYIYNSMSLAIATSQQYLSPSSQIPFSRCKKMVKDLIKSIMSVDFFNKTALDQILNGQLSQSILEMFIKSQQHQPAEGTDNKTIEMISRRHDKKSKRKMIKKIYRR